MYRSKFTKFVTILTILLILFTVGSTMGAGWASPFQILMLSIGAMVFLLVFMKPYIGILLVVILIFAPLSFGTILGIRSLLLYEVFIPVATLCYFLPKFLKKESIKVFKRTNFLLIPILIYFLVIFVNYLRNPLPPSGLMGLREEVGGFKVYYKYFLCLCVYFVFAEMAATDIKHTRIAFSTMWSATFAFTLIGLAMITVPFVRNIILDFQREGMMLDAVQWTVLTMGYGGYRVGLLSNVCPVALFLMVSRSININRRLMTVLFVFFLIGLILSGGRVSFVATSIALFVWVLTQKKWSLFPLVVLGGLAIYLSVFVYYDKLPGVLHRIFLFRGGLSQLDFGRYTMFLTSLGLFLKSPISGVGFGSTTQTGARTFFEYHFLYRHLRYGGHSAYLSLLMLTGLLGTIPFLWILWRSTRSAFSLCHRSRNQMLKAFGLFCLLSLVYYSIALMFGGRGSELWFFLIVGLTSGLYMNTKYVESPNVSPASKVGDSSILKPS